MAKRPSLRNLARLANPTTRTAEAFKQGGAVGGLPSTASGLSLMRINVLTQGDDLIETLNECGFKYDETDIAIKLDKLSAKVLNNLSDTALKAFQSTVPVGYFSQRSGVLRDLHIKVTGGPYQGPSTPGRFRSGSGVQLSRDIFVDNKQHYSFYRKKTLTASSLADFLETSQQKRSRMSEPYAGFRSVAKGMPAAGWIEEAVSQFNELKPSVIRKATI